MAINGSAPIESPHAFELRAARGEDLNALVELEQACFTSDRISPRRFRHWLKAHNCVFQVAHDADGLLGYGLVILHRGTRLARLYSLAVSARARGRGVGHTLIEKLERLSAKRARLFMRLEVAKTNAAAVHLYRKLGYRLFGEYPNYYEDQVDALRMQKRIRHLENAQPMHPVPWYRQTTEFTCGPASLIMAMTSLDPRIEASQELELDIWREATTIFMTSGHGGCHPLGLALAAHARGFEASVLISSAKPLFVESVRSEHKKAILKVVDMQFRNKAKKQGISVVKAELSQQHLQHWLDQGYVVVILISSYRLDGRKVPHWVTLTTMDELCLYVHDPDPDEQTQDPVDCQHIPIARADFAKMSAFGNERLRTAVAIKCR